jgi:hypothetical protein
VAKDCRCQLYETRRCVDCGRSRVEAGRSRCLASSIRRLSHGPGQAREAWSEEEGSQVEDAGKEEEREEGREGPGLGGEKADW